MCSAAPVRWSSSAISGAGCIGRRGIGRGGCGGSGSRSRCSSPCSSSYELFDLWSWPAATAWLVIGYFARGAARRSDVHRRGLLQVRLPGGPVQLHRVHAVAAGNRRARARRCAAGARPSTASRDGARNPRRRTSRSAAASLRSSCRSKVGQPRLHLLPRLRAGVPARQRRHPLPRAWRRAGGRPPPLVDRTPLAARRPRRARDGVHVRRAAQRLRDDRAGLRDRDVARAARSARPAKRRCSGSCS